MYINKTKEDIRQSIRSFMLENFLFGYDEKELDDDSSFLEMGILDSTGIMELVSLIEKEFGVKVQDYEIIPDNLDSVNCILDYLYKKLDCIAKE